MGRVAVATKEKAPAGIGHNIGVSSEELMSFINRIENLIESRQETNAEIKEVYDEAAGQGFDKRTIREVIRLRALDPATLEERESLRDRYLSAIGLI